jgi:hypothetical protein
MTLLIVVVITLTAAITWILLRARQRYAPLFEDAHFRELVASLPRLKTAAFNHLGQVIQAPVDPRIVHTSAMVTIVYTAEEVEGGNAILSHLSLSRAGAYLTWAAGGRFAHVMLRHLGIAPDQAAVALDPAGVVHVAFVLPSEGRDSFVAAPVASLPPDLTAMKQEAGAFMSATLRSGRLLRDERQLVHHLLGAA